MFKSVPASNVSEKSFYVYKEWSQTEADYPVIVAYSETGSMAFDTGSATQSSGYYVSPLWHSIKTKYYSSNGNTITQFGIVRNPASFTTERSYADTVYVIQIPQSNYGEQIKPGSVILEDVTNNNTWVDNRFGSLGAQQPIYEFISYDAETQEIIFFDIVNGQTTLSLSFFDANTGIGTFSYGGSTDNYAILEVDFETGLITFSEGFDFSQLQSDLEINTSKAGNVFYDDGLIVMTNEIPFTEYLLRYRSTAKITETSILISVKAGEFNTSQNPTAVDVSIFQSSSFETTAVRNSKPAGTVTIKEVLDISKKQYFVSNFNSTISGSWDDYFESSSIDPTGSYIAPYITTIGLYDENLDMVAVGKLPTPIKNLPDYDLNFIIRFDT